MHEVENTNESSYIPQPNPKQAYGDKKVKLQLVPPAAAIAIAKGLAEGAEKYSPWNWRDDPVEVMTYVGATYRHLAAWVEGEDVDPDSAHGKTHLEGAIASLAILIDSLAMGNAIDNRPKSAAGALAQLQQGSREPVGEIPFPNPLPTSVEPVDWKNADFCEDTSNIAASLAGSSIEKMFSFLSIEARDTTLLWSVNWDEAPEWANYLAFDECGAMWWFSHEPDPCSDEWLEKDEHALQCRSRPASNEKLFDYCGDWQDMLFKRPGGET